MGIAIVLADVYRRLFEANMELSLTMVKLYGANLIILYILSICFSNVLKYVGLISFFGKRE